MQDSNEKIQVRKKYLFGNENFYPECQKSRFFAEIAGSPFLSKECIGLIKKLGYVIQQVL
jgi:hypothetical protein